MASCQVRSLAVPNWEEEFEKLYQQDENRIIFLVSPPGAGKQKNWFLSNLEAIGLVNADKDPHGFLLSGKTHLLENRIIKNEKDKRCQMLDCSNDELVERAMESFLTEAFPDERKKSLLVADEFHMLSKDHKEELIAWATKRLYWLKVILIGNRKNGNMKS